MAYDAHRNRTSVGCNEEPSVKIRVMVLSVSNVVCDWSWNFICLSNSQAGDLYRTGTKTCVMSWDCKNSTTLGTDILHIQLLDSATGDVPHYPVARRNDKRHFQAP